MYNLPGLVQWIRSYINFIRTQKYTCLVESSCAQRNATRKSAIVHPLLKAPSSIDIDCREMETESLLVQSYMEFLPWLVLNDDCS